MKLLALFLTVLALLPNASRAHPQLEQLMKIVGVNFKAISREVAQSGITDLTVKSAEEIAVAVKQARDIMPDKVEKLSEPERSAAFEKFQNMLSQLAEQNSLLITALVARDLTRANDAIRAMMAIRKDGHDLFK